MNATEEADRGTVPEGWLNAQEQPKVYTKDPYKTWDRWYKEALRRGNKWAHNMVLCTCGNDMQPQLRTVTLHIWDEKGFVFCTNYDGPKAKELSENPLASVCFRWPELNRQVRITGTVSKVSQAETEFLFRRCRNVEQINFYAFAHGKDHAFNQSNVVENTDDLAIYTRDVFSQYADKEVPLPKKWGGYRLEPLSIDFLDAGVPWNMRVLWSREGKATTTTDGKVEDKPVVCEQISDERKTVVAEDGFTWSSCNLVP